MTIHLSKELEQFVHEAVRAGLYAREDDVVRDALTRLKQSMPERRQGADAAPGVAEPVSADEEIQRRLLAAGLVHEIKPPIRDVTPYRGRQAVPIKGEPLSETVVRERR